MRLVLPGGAVLTEGRSVSCRPGAAVQEQTLPRPVPALARTQANAPVTSAPPVQQAPPAAKPGFFERLTNLKLVLEVLAIFVGLLTAILALIGAILKWRE